MKAKRLDPVKFPQFDSIAQASAATGVPVGALRLAKRSGCEAFKHGRVDFGLFIRWFFEQPSSDTKDWLSENKRLDALIKEVKLDELKKRVVDFGEVTQFLQALIGGCFFGELDRLANEFPPALKGKTEIQIHTRVAKEIETIRSILRKRLEAWQKKGEASDE